MSIDIIHRRRQGKHFIEAIVPGDKGDARIYWRSDKSGFMLKFKCSGTWYYQWLHWSCRAGRPSYFRPMIALYRLLRKEGLASGKSLHELAGA